MEDLKALVQIVSKQKVKQIRIISEDAKISSKAKTLYESVLTGKFASDEEASQALYGAAANNAKYKKLKYRLKKRLINTLFFIDLNQPTFTEYKRAYHQTVKNWSTVRILLDRTARRTAMNLCENAIKHSIHYGFTDLTLLFARDLRKHYGYLQPNKRKFKYYDELVQRTSQDLMAELEAEKYYSIISNAYVVSKAAKKSSIIGMTDEFCERLRELKADHDTYIVNLTLFNLLVSRHVIGHNFEEAKQVCIEALSYFKDKPFNSKVIQYAFQNDLLFCHLQLREYDLAEDYILKNLELLTPGSFNWFPVMNYYFILGSATERFTELYKITSEVLSNPKLKQYAVHQQSWLIKEAYVHFLIRMGKIDPERSDTEPLRPFRLGRFLNEVPIFSKDKRGLNIPIIIIQLLFLILDRKYSRVLDRIDALRQYSYRYLRNDETFRSNCFIKMLLKAVDADYHPIRTQRYTAKLYARLVSTPMNISEQSTEIEIIPYESLWEIVLELLQKNKRA